MKLETFSDDGFVDLFDGKTLKGWRSVPRGYFPFYPGGPSLREVAEERGITLLSNPEKYPAAWSVEDGVIVGQQATKSYGGYLVSEEAFGEFEVVLEANPDWPADTGIMLRRQRDSMECIQLLLDHRRSGNLGGFYGNSIGMFHAVNYTLDAETDESGKAIGIKLEEDNETSYEPLTPEKINLLSYACDPKDLIKVWKFQDWNEIRVRCVGGPLPKLTSWINGLKVAELDVSTIKWPNFVPEDVAAMLGPRGHIALEVHDNDSRLGDARWGPGAKCRWRNLRIKNLG